MEQREEALFEQSKTAVIIDEEGETIKSINNILDIDISNWTNEMMKKVINRISVDMDKNDIEIVYNHTISSK